jgi:hypothetical protein
MHPFQVDEPPPPPHTAPLFKISVKTSAIAILIYKPDLFWQQ